MISPLDGKTSPPGRTRITKQEHERCKAEFGESLKALQVLLASLVAQNDTTAVAWLVLSLEAIIENTRDLQAHTARPETIWA